MWLKRCAVKGVLAVLFTAALLVFGCGKGEASRSDTAKSAPQGSAGAKEAGAKEAGAKEAGAKEAGAKEAGAQIAAPITLPKGRVVILGFDGVEPTIVDAMMKAGELPNLAKLGEKGVYKRLLSSIPPQSPTAWTSFITCKRPGEHGIYDFLRRQPKYYAPDFGFGVAKNPELAPDGAMAKIGEFVNYRKGESFWMEANKQGARCKILLVPFAYPAEDLHDSCELCGLDVRDIRGGTSTFFLMSDSFTPEQREHPELAGGLRLALDFQGDTATVNLPGARDLTKEKATYVEVPISVQADREARKITLKLPDQSVELAEGGWTKWIEWQFRVTDQFTVYAISRIHALEVGEQVRLYMTCLQYHPKHPYIRFSTPESYAGELADRMGLYKTIGWTYDTHALRQDALTEDVFLDDVRNTLRWKETLTADEIERDNFDLLVSASTATDRVAHMFWRFRDAKHPLYTADGAKKYGRAVEDTYTLMDEFVGKVTEKLRDGDLLMILSDHGFHSYRKGFNVNTWLIRNGYLGVVGQSDPATAVNEEAFLKDYDWPKTKAYGFGLGSIYLNIKGREGQGIVAPEEAAALRKELKEKLLAVTDPETGDKIFDNVYTREEAYTGASEADAPDIELGYAEGYQSTKDAAKGAAPKELFAPNDDKWSGEHAASDCAKTPGVFFCNQPITVDTPSLLDLGVTALKYMGLEVPADYEGKPLL